MRLNLSLLLTLAMASGVSSPVFSHHSHSMFDHEKEVTITGIVTEFTFRNPHVFLFVDVENETGEVVNYWVEMGTIPGMIRRGVGAKTFQSGDAISVNMYPLTDGRPGGSYHTIVAADGKTYN
ncbi:MAG: DUF6152 family protein [Gammaproteobacteria bacterium]